MNLDEKLKSIELILSDVDGVLTDGRLIYDNQGIESKAFYIQDGQGIRLWSKAGHPFGLITLRSSHIVRTRASELGIEILRQGVHEKLPTVKDICEELDLGPERVCYLGDDLPDIPVIRYVGLGVAVANACDEARAAADYVTTAPGGAGAVRETVEMILKAQDRWQDAIRAYVA